MPDKKIKSIKARLFLSLTGLIITILLITDLAAFLFTRHEIQELFDANLIKSSKLILNLLKDEALETDNKDLAHKIKNSENIYNTNSFHAYEYKIHYQAWKKGALLYSSDQTINVEEPKLEGFQDNIIGGRRWRSFSIYDAKYDIKIITLEKYGVRSDLIRKILTSLIIPLSLSLIPIILIIWSTINKKFRPLNKLSEKIKQMSASTLEPISNQNLPLEIKPFIDSLNSLLFKLQESMESERRFTDYAAHELRTPLAATKTISQLILKNHDAGKQEEFIGDLIKSVDRATHLINQLFTLSRLESENKNFEKESANLTEITKNLISSYSEELISKNINIKISAEDKVLMICNKTYIEIMFRNLIDNAIKYSAKNGQIEIEISEENSQVIFKITNNGEEISPGEAEKIFDKFYRIKKNGEDITGCGLGLAISKKITELHNGKINFYSGGGKNIMEVRFLLSNQNI